MNLQVFVTSHLCRLHDLQIGDMYGRTKAALSVDT